jgi:hypothetical protein
MRYSLILVGLSFLFVCMPGVSGEVKETRDNHEMERQILQIQTSLQELESGQETVRKADPDMGLWMQQQQLLLKRILANIQIDLKDTQISESDKAVVVQSQLDDGRFLSDRVLEELRFLQDGYLKKEKTETINVKDFGAKGDGVSDDGPAIRNAISKARKSANPLVVLPKGRYYIATPQTIKTSRPTHADRENISAHLIFQNVKNLRMEGEGGAELILGTPTVNGIVLNECENVSIKHLTIDYQPLPFVQGKVVALVDERTFDMEVDEGFAAPSQRLYQADFPLLRFFSQESFGTSPFPAYFNGFPYIVPASVSLLKDKTYRLVIEPSKSSGNANGLKVGARAVQYARQYTEMAISLFYSKRTRLEDLHIYSSPGMNFYMAFSDFAVIKNCTAEPKPGTGRYISSNADGIYLRDNRFGPYVQGCKIIGISDDYVNIHNILHQVEDSDNKQKIYIKKAGYPNDFRVGDRLGFFQGTGEIREEALISGISMLKRGAEDLAEITFTKQLKTSPYSAVSVGGDAGGYRPDKCPDMIANLSTSNQGFVFYGNEFSHGQSRLLIAGYNGIFSNNKALDNLCHDKFLQVGMDTMSPFQVEGHLSRNLVFKANTFETNWGKRMLAFHQNLLKNIPCHTAPLRHMLFQDNVFIRGSINQDSLPTIAIRDVSHLEFSGNTIKHLKGDSSVAINVIDSQSVFVGKNMIYSQEKDPLLIKNKPGFSDNKSNENTVLPPER